MKYNKQDGIKQYLKRKSICNVASGPKVIPIMALEK